MARHFTDEVKQELARTPLGDEPIARIELASLLRFGGALIVSGGDVRRLTIELETASGATARRTYALLQHTYGVRPELWVRAPAGVRTRQVYGIRLEADGGAIGRDLGLLDDDGRPVEARPGPGGRRSAVATVRGGFLASGSISSPDRSPHLEIAAHDDGAAEVLAGFARQLVDGTVSGPVIGADRPRVVVKSGAVIGELLAVLGATTAFLQWDDRRLRRQVRGEATRLANADAANLRRSVAAAAVQVEAVERVVAALGWDELDDDLRGVALARLTSPDASITELGQLTEPPSSRSSVHRRLKRLEKLAAEIGAPEGHR